MTLDDNTDDSFYVNRNTQTYVAHSWLAGTAFSNDASATSVGSIDSEGQVNTDAGFSIIKYTGGGAAATIAHGLGAVPEMIILKRRDGGAGGWYVYHADMNSAPEQKYLQLQLTDAIADGTFPWNDTAPTSAVFSVGSDTGVSGSGTTYIAYLFKSVDGYSSFGNYDARGGTQQFVYTGFPVGFLMVKRTDSADNWTVHDVGRDPTGNPSDSYLLYDNNAAEATYSTALVDFYSNGFCWKGAVNYGNNSSGHYIYMAFSRGTGFKYSTAI